LGLGLSLRGIQRSRLESRFQFSGNLILRCSEVQRLITEQYERANALLLKHQAALKSLAEQLLKHETVEGSAVQAALAQIAPEVASKP
jgi:hypothetical protein